jgi:hypothetical protein
MAKFVKGQKSVGRVYVKATDTVNGDHQPGQWVKLRGQKKLARLAHEGFLVTPTRNRGISMAELRLACGKSRRNVLTKAKTADNTLSVEALLSLFV